MPSTPVSEPLYVSSPANAARPLAPAVSVLIAIRPLPSTLVKDSLKLVFASNRGATTSKRLAGQVKLSERYRPFGLRMPCNDGDRQIGAKVRSRALARDQPRAGDGDPSLEPAAQPSRALQRDADAARTASQAQCCCPRRRATNRAAERLVASAAAASCRSGPSSPCRGPACRAAERRERPPDKPGNCRPASAASG